MKGSHSYTKLNVMPGGVGALDERPPFRYGPLHYFVLQDRDERMAKLSRMHHMVAGGGVFMADV